MKDLTIVIPAYNEEKALTSFLPELISFCETNGCRLIIVNDGSRDNTAGLLARFQSVPGVVVLHHKVNRGYGGALKTGIGAVDTAYVITIDADGQHRLADVEELYKVLRETDADMVIGRREGYRESLYRKTGKAIIRSIARLLLPLQIRDLNSGMKVYRAALVRQFLHLCPDNMAFSDIITLIFIHQRHLVCEHPITVAARTGGKSTISTKTALDTAMEILHIVTLFNPMRVFFPPAFFFLIFSGIWGIPIILRGEGVSVGTLFLFVTGLILFFLGLIAEQLALIRKNLSFAKIQNLAPDE